MADLKMSANILPPWAFSVPWTLVPGKDSHSGAMAWIFVLIFFLLMMVWSRLN